jgi:hypothetical protein
MLHKEVAEELGVIYLGPANKQPTFPVFGILFGFNSRGLMNLACQITYFKITDAKIVDSKMTDDERINITFLVDTGKIKHSTVLCK